MIEIIQQRLATYRAANPLEEEQALKEILQEVALFALWRAAFFEVAAFQGGTSLRILHKLPRFSEDLDFILKESNRDFQWDRYLGPLAEGLQEFGLKSEVLDKSRMDQVIRKAILKDNSISQQLNLSFVHGSADRALKIKLEIDVDPPAGSGFEYTYLDFPLDFEVCHQDLSSNFALKIHALLCRSFLKGRDWYDFVWYLKQEVTPNYPLLLSAINQAGPWKGQHIPVNRDWLQAELRSKVESIDWAAAAEDVSRFLDQLQRESLRMWSIRFFLSKVEQLNRD
ncbi:MAG: nucleotidyl transferase AbiEii/AbiGii toxin family protein [Xanthomonadales bacterium]|nr:nucleotidyl transferase AbiEii/AbiGii toxin family protein [Xanthomonadales bacterium]